MTFETMMLRSLFGACVLICGLALAAMVTARPVPVQLAAHTTNNASLVATPAAAHAGTAG
jgi:hypothetical protein